MLEKQRIITYAKSLNEALREEMLHNDKVVLLGEDIGVYGNIFGVTRGLLNEFGSERVIDTPISEAGFLGAAIGLAVKGFKPIVEIMYMDFINCCMDQLVNNLTKIRFLSGGRVKAPVIVRTQISCGPGRYTGPQHSQDLISWFMHVPGIKIVAPSTPYDAKGMLKTAIRYEEDPVLFIEHALLYRMKGHIPLEEYFIPFGEAKVVREGCDVTLVSYSYMVHVALKAAERLESDEVSVEVVDLRSLVPLDIDTAIKSVRKTGRIITLETGCKTCGVGAEIIAEVVEKALEHLQTRPIRLAIPDTPVPFSPPLLKEIVPSEKTVVKAVKELMSRG